MMVATPAFALDNLAAGGSASATYGDATLAIDQNTGTRWEATAGNFTDSGSEACDWVLDMGEDKAFNLIQIVWEGAYSKSFELAVSNDGHTYHKVYTATDETPAFGTPTSYRVGDQNARYIKFTNVARGTQWGVSFWEFYVYNQSSSTLNSINLSADKSVAKIGETVSLTAKGYDEFNAEINTDNLTYEVTPSSIGSVNGNTFTVANSGVATIVAKSGDITSNTITVSCYEGDKINIFADWQNMVSPLNDETTTGSMVGAFDDNMGSLWDMHAGTGGSEEERTYETGFTVDFGALYDVTAVSMTFEGACPADYKVYAIDMNDKETEIYSVTGHAGMATYTDFFLADAKETRKVKFVSTKAATQYGVKVFDFSVYATNRQDIPDTQAPTLFTAALAEDVANIESLTLKLSATDDISSNISYEISYSSDASETAVATATGKSGEELTYTLGGLKGGVEYTLSIVAKDAKGNATEAIVIKATPESMKAAPAPEAPVHEVFPIFSSAYGDATGCYTPEWGQQTQTIRVEVDGSNPYLLQGLNYQGFEFQRYDVTGYKGLHIDIFPLGDATSIGIVPIWRNAADNANGKEIRYMATGLTPNQWNSIDIPMSDFSSDDDGREGTNVVYQLKIDEGNGKTYYLDNAYFYGFEDTEAPVWAEDHTPSYQLTDNGVRISIKANDNCGAGTITYTVETLEYVGEAANDPSAAMRAAEAVDTPISATARPGEVAQLDIPGLKDNSIYNVEISASDAAGNKSAENKTLQITTGDTTSGIGSITTDEIPAETVVYDLNGRRVTHPAAGQIYIVNGKKMIVR